MPDPAAVLTPYVIKAVPDAAPLSVPSTGGLAVANVLSNDRIGGLPVTLAHVTLSKPSSTDARIKLDTGTGAVTVTAGAALGAHSLVYRICEIADPSNCDDATAAVTVVPTPLVAADDIGISTRSGGVAQGNVLANDTLQGTAATLSRQLRRCAGNRYGKSVSH